MIRAVAHLRKAMHMFRDAGVYVSRCNRIDALVRTQAAVFVSLQRRFGLAQNSGLRVGLRPEHGQFGDPIHSGVLCSSNRTSGAGHATLSQMGQFCSLEDASPISCSIGLAPSSSTCLWRHTLTAAGDEITYLADQLRLFSMLASVETPAFDELTQYLTVERDVSLYAPEPVCV